jgi:hypothetical protein
LSAVSFEAAFSAAEGVEFIRWWWVSVGVGGVTTVAGPCVVGGVAGSAVIIGRGLKAFLGEGVFSPGSWKIG